MNENDLKILICNFNLLKSLILILLFCTNNKDDEKYAHLNIAWDKYRIVDTQSIPEAMRGKYEFYCVLCNKYMQKKPQLVDVKITTTNKNITNIYIFLTVSLILKAKKS